MPGPYSYAESGGFADRFQAIDRRLAALERSTRGAISGDGATTFLNAGDFIVRNDGSIVLLEADGDQRAVLSPTGLRLNDGAGTKLLDLTNLGLQAYEADGSVLSILDGSKLRFNRSDGTRALEITPAGGQKIYGTDGTTEKVILDGDGLTVDGGTVRALAVSDPLAAAWNNVSLTSTFSTQATLAFTPPSWATEVLVFAFASAQINNSADGHGIVTRINIEGVTGGAATMSINDSASILNVFTARFPKLTSWTGTIDVTQEVRTTSGTSSANAGYLRASFISLR